MATKQLLTTKQVMAGFSTSDMTIYSWRKGTPTKTVLPCVKVGASVRFEPAAMKAWAKEHGLKFSLEAALAVPAAKGKTGPKPKIQPLAASAVEVAHSPKKLVVVSTPALVKSASPKKARKATPPDARAAATA